MGQWIYGTELAKKIQEEVAAEVGRIRECGILPGLAVILVGDDPASHVHVRGKVRTCEALGMHSGRIELPASSTTEEILANVIDVGVNRVDSRDRIRQIFGEDPQRLADLEKKGYTLAGDVNPVKVFPKCSYLTPVPGGVGPLTIAMLMANTARAAGAMRGDTVLSVTEGPRP